MKNTAKVFLKTFAEGDDNRYEDSNLLPLATNEWVYYTTRLEKQHVLEKTNPIDLASEGFTNITIEKPKQQSANDFRLFFAETDIYLRVKEKIKAERVTRVE
jgi:hypothetical protein